MAGTLGEDCASHVPESEDANAGSLSEAPADFAQFWGIPMAARGRIYAEDGRVSAISFERADGSIISGAGRERRRALQSMRPMLDAKLTDELQLLQRSSSASSASVVSVNVGYDRSTERCDSHCWLRNASPRSQPSIALVENSTSSGNVWSSRDIYTPLSSTQIRILNLKRGAIGTRIECSFSVIEVRGADQAVRPESKYEALSYTWGEPNPKQPIHCDGRQLDVAPNLYGALHRLRRTNEDRLLWVDALCINQEDVEERNSQVRQMIEIYRKAKKVLVWLGDARDDSEWAMDIVPQLDKLESRKNLLEISHGEECLRKLMRYYFALLALYSRPWFLRTWIRQEVAVANGLTVFCGTSILSWGSFKRTASRLRRVYGILSEEFQGSITSPETTGILNLKNLRKNWQQGETVLGMTSETDSVYKAHTGKLLDLLMFGRAFDSTDPRDKVYAVLGLAGDPIEGLTESEALPGQERMVVDYSSSVSEVYQRVAKYMINRDRNFDILCILSTHRGPESGDLPSWTPDWRTSTAHTDLWECWDYASIPFAATGDTKAQFQSYDDLGQLKVEAFGCAILQHVLDVTSDVSGLTKMAFKMQQARADQAPDSDHQTEARDQGAEHEDDREDSYNIAPFDARRHRRRMGIGQEGMPCLVPSHAQEGDAVFLILGARLPFVLRYKPDPAKSGMGNHRLEQDSNSR